MDRKRVMAYTQLLQVEILVRVAISDQVSVLGPYATCSLALIQHVDLSGRPSQVAFELWDRISTGLHCLQYSWQESRSLAFRGNMCSCMVACRGDRGGRNVHVTGDEELMLIVQSGTCDDSV